MAYVNEAPDRQKIICVAYLPHLTGSNKQLRAQCPIPAEFCVHGYYYRYRKHFVYWKVLRTGDTGIVTVLHEKMHQIAHFQDDAFN